MCDWWVSKEVSVAERGSWQRVVGGKVRKVMDDQTRQGLEGHCKDFGFFSK